MKVININNFLNVLIEIEKLSHSPHFPVHFPLLFWVDFFFFFTRLEEPRGDNGNPGHPEAAKGNQQQKEPKVIRNQRQNLEKEISIVQI